MFRSQEIVLCQLLLQDESAFTSVSNLGESSHVQFRDTNSSTNAYQRKFIDDIQKCDEMERKLTYIEKEIIKEEIQMDDVIDNPIAPQSREMLDLQKTIGKFESELKEIKSNIEPLKKTFFDLSELKSVLLQAQTFFGDQDAQYQADTLDDNTSLLEMEFETPEPDKHGFVIGTIFRKRLFGFERMLWRVCRGSIFLKQGDIAPVLEDPITGEKLDKVVFILFFLHAYHIKTICDGFHATLYSCPETFKERENMLSQVKTKIEDLSRILNQTNEHRRILLVEAAKNIQMWFVQVCKVKAIYHTMNLFNQDFTKNCLIAECWCPISMLPAVQEALQDASAQCGSPMPSIVNCMETKDSPPTYNSVNKFTVGFQNIVDAYGVATYKEINPCIPPYTIITFPFLFAVMFGDAGHGLIMTLFAFWMIIREKKLMTNTSKNEIWITMFGGRYIILLMGLFSIYTGMIYNDAFSKSMNIFGTGWTIPQNISLVKKLPNTKITMILDPNVTFYHGEPYLFGIDPIWQTATNKILFLNSYKMKLSIIFGVSQMLFGVTLSLWNHVYFRRYLNILCEFIPQLIFLLSIFGYLVFLIFMKWVIYDSTEAACAPSLLISLINMFLNHYTDKPCYLANMYEPQETVQLTLVAIAFICIPWMLLIKPIVKHINRNNNDVAPSEGHEEEGFGDLFIHQAIHTIEYCLGTISHTASYLRLWALSLAHAQLSEVLWNMVMKIAISQTSYAGSIVVYVIFAAWASLTIGILLIMEGLSAFLHALRLHWVEFQSKFYEGQGYLFVPFSLKGISRRKT